mmetsp:Transcript_50985/g.119189  ORF Transcript_50985/g.119189 Transcript_50985/m.119189 type:complete len:624 (-) Transcript_50985:224-2095(-)
MGRRGLCLRRVNILHAGLALLLGYISREASCTLLAFVATYQHEAAQPARRMSVQRAARGAERPRDVPLIPKVGDVVARSNESLAGPSPPKQRAGRFAWQPRKRSERASDAEEPTSRLPGWFNELRDEGLEADDNTYNALIGASARASDLEAAGRFAREAQKAGSQPSATSFDALVEVSLAQKSLDDAIVWIEQAYTEAGISLRTSRLVEVVQAAGRTKNLDCIHTLLACMPEADVEAKAAVVAEALKAASASGDVATAMRWFGQAIESGTSLPRDAYTSFITEVANGCGYGVAEFWVRQAQTVGLEPDIQAYSALFLATWRSGEKDIGRKMLAKVLASTDAKESSLETVTRAALNTGDTDAVEYLLDLVQEEGLEFKVDSDIASRIIGLAARTGDFEATESWFQRLYEEGTMRPVLWTYVTMVNAAATDAGSDEAERWYKKTLEAGFQPDHVMFHILMRSAAKQGNEERTRAWFAEAKKAGVPISSMHYTTLANAAAKQGNLDGAEKWLEEAKAANLSMDCYLYSAVIDAASKAGNLASAERWFEELKETGMELSVVPYNTMMGAAMRMARPWQTEELFRELVDSGLQPTDRTLGTLRWAVGKSRVQQLCGELGLNVTAIMQR